MPSLPDGSDTVCWVKAIKQKGQRTKTYNKETAKISIIVFNQFILLTMHRSTEQ